MIYAAGEILLVMVGILLALQVNNWNQASTNRDTEFQVLQSILSNLEEDASTLDQVTERLALSIQSIDRIHQAGAPIPGDSLRYYVTRANGDQTFIPLTAAFDLSSNSGKLVLCHTDSDG